MLALATPAHAQRAWSDPEPIANPLPGIAQAAVAADGTRIVASETTDAIGDTRLTVRFNDAAPVNLGLAQSAALVAAAPGGRAVVAYTASPTGTAHGVAVFTLPDGTFTAPQDLGAGVPLALAMNAAGDAVVVTKRPDVCQADVCVGATNSQTAFRPADGAFGTPVDLPVGSLAGLAIDGAGNQSYGLTTGGFSVASRHRGDALAAPVPLSAEASFGTVAADGQGRVLAVWNENDASILTAVRSAAGSWGTPNSLALPAAVRSVVAGVDSAGDAVVAWRDVEDVFGPNGGPLRVATGSLADGRLSAPQTLDPGSGSGPQLATAPDGSTIIAETNAVTQSVRVVRRDGTGAFGVPQVAACHAKGPPDFSVGGIGPDGVATLVVERALVHDAAATTASNRICRIPESPRSPSATYSRTPVVAGEPVMLYPDVRRADFDVTSYAFDLN
ncbi:MAG: hypothetical protein QOF76_3514, partial [Solirubrobacteraceae bacterium]|nr:hypothetical protein [Solirubrobacteraceae bacterium]